MKNLYIDVETTGLLSTHHGIIALAYIIDDEQDNTLAKGVVYMDPTSYKKYINPKALEVNGFSQSQF